RPHRSRSGTVGNRWEPPLGTVRQARPYWRKPHFEGLGNRTPPEPVQFWFPTRPTHCGDAEGVKAEWFSRRRRRRRRSAREAGEDTGAPLQDGFVWQKTILALRCVRLVDGWVNAQRAVRAAHLLHLTPSPSPPSDGGEGGVGRRAGDSAAPPSKAERKAQRPKNDLVSSP